MFETTTKLISRVVLLIVVVVFIITAGAFIFLQFEDWTVVEAFYFATVTLTTVGYGDITPTTEASRVVTIIYSLLTIPLFFLMIGLFGEVVFTKYIDRAVRAHTRTSIKRLKKTRK